MHRPDLKSRSLPQEGTGSVRFVSVRFVLKIKRFGSVRFGNKHFPGSTRFGQRFFARVVARFGSVPRPVPAGSEIKRFGSVSCSFLLPGGTTCLTLLVYHRFSSNVANHATNGDPRHEKPRVKRMRPY